MTPLSERLPIRSLRYGGNGSGKTVMSFTWPIDTSIGEWAFVFDFDDGLASVRNHLGKLKAGYYAKTFIDRDFKIGSAISKQDNKGKTAASFIQRQSKSWQTAKEFLEYLKQGLPKTFREELGLPDNTSEYPTVVIADTLTGLHDIAGNKAFQLSGSYGMMGSMAEHHYPAQMHAVKEFILMLEAEMWHVDVTAHEHIFEDAKKKTLVKQIAVVGRKTAGFVPAYFDEYYHHEVIQGADNAYIIETASSGSNSAKTGMGFDSETGHHIFDFEEEVTIKPNTIVGWERLLEKVDAYWKEKEGGV